MLSICLDDQCHQILRIIAYFIFGKLSFSIIIILSLIYPFQVLFLRAIRSSFIVEEVYQIKNIVLEKP